LFLSLGPSVYFAGFVKIIYDIGMFLQPVLIAAIIRFIEDPSQPTYYGLLYVAAFFVDTFVDTFGLTRYFFIMFYQGIRVSNLRDPNAMRLYWISKSTLYRCSME
jgi:hypothetical protein